MAKNPWRFDHSSDNPEGWVVMRIGAPAPPGTPRGRTCTRPYEEIKHLLTGEGYLRPGDPYPPRRRKRGSRRRRD
jgi:hypothetical protein